MTDPQRIIVTALTTRTMPPVFLLRLDPCNPPRLASSNTTDERRSFVPLGHPPAARTVATPLAAERPCLTLVREDDRAATVVRELDERLAPYASPVQVGTTERFHDPYGPERIGFRYHGVGGEDIIVLIPARAETRISVQAVREMIDEVVAELG